MPLRLHHAQLMLHAQQRAEHVGVKGGGVALSGLIGYRTGNAFSSRIVNRHIQSTEPRDSLIDQSANLILEGGGFALALEDMSASLPFTTSNVYSASNDRCADQP